MGADGAEGRMCRLPSQETMDIRPWPVYARGAMADTCFHCSAPATLLCDFHIGQIIGEFERVGALGENRWRAVTTLEACDKHGAAFYTCDRPICKECAVNIGRVHFCAGKDSSIDTVDLCREHAIIDDSSAPMLTEAEAERIRYELHKRITQPRGKPELVI